MNKSLCNTCQSEGKWWFEEIGAGMKISCSDHKPVEPYVTIIVDNDIGLFDTMVGDKIKKGYLPHGGMIVKFSPKGRETFIQPMIHREYQPLYLINDHE